jgi:hypothetical protein
MKKCVFLILFIISIFRLNAGKPNIDYEMFSIGGNLIYSVEDAYTGLNGKLTFPLSSKYVSLVFQGVIFPSQMQSGEKTFDEIRSKINVQITPIHIGAFSTYFQAGFDNGAWKRAVKIIGSNSHKKWQIDESIMLGAGFNYNVKSIRLYLDWMYMPDIYSNHIGVGMHILLFEKKLFRKFYLQRRKKSSIFNIKYRRKKRVGSIKL